MIETVSHDRLRVRTAALVIAMVALALPVVAVSAPTAAPPLGKYTCYRYGATILYQGWMTLTTRSSYTVYTGAKGAYTVSGATLRFTSGAYCGWTGKYTYDKTRTAHKIELRAGTRYRATCSRPG